VAVAVLAIAVIGGTMMREGVGREDGGASAGPVTSPPTTAASPDGSAIETAADFPTEAEEELLAAIDAAVRDRCVRAAQGPIYLSGAGRAFDEPMYPVPVNYVASIDCDLGGISAPDRVQYWQLPPGGSVDPLAPDSVTPNVILHQRAGINAATDSACSAGPPALEEWSFGRTGGKLVCYETATGDAILWWTYDDTDIIATAVRDDLNMAALLEWWTADARFAP
jgi:hypothetical protein